VHTCVSPFAIVAVRHAVAAADGCVDVGAHARAPRGAHADAAAQAREKLAELVRRAFVVSCAAFGVDLRVIHRRVRGLIRRCIAGLIDRVVDRVVRGHVPGPVHVLRRIGPVTRVRPIDDVGVPRGTALAAAARREKSGCEEKRYEEPWFRFHFSPPFHDDTSNHYSCNIYFCNSAVHDVRDCMALS
jgi:hypothetical protein